MAKVPETPRMSKNRKFSNCPDLNRTTFFLTSKALQDAQKEFVEPCPSCFRSNKPFSAAVRAVYSSTPNGENAGNPENSKNRTISNYPDLDRTTFFDIESTPFLGVLQDAHEDFVEPCPPCFRSNKPFSGASRAVHSNTQNGQNDGNPEDTT